MYTVTVSSSIEHGKVSVDKTSAEAGATVKLAATADNGYELESYSVIDADGKAVTVTDDKFTMPESNVTVSATFKETAETANRNAANAVIAKINAIGTVEYTDESKAKIDEARTAYDALTEAQKALVSEETLNLLTAAESAYAELKAAAEQQTAGSISYATTTVSKTTADTAFTNELTKTGDGTVSYASDNTAVATVDSNGLVTIVGAGTATITATVTDSETYTYATKTASYTLAVTQATPSYTVSIASGIEHGTVTADKTSAEKGATVTLTLSASDGYEFGTFSVTDASNAEITTTAVTEGSKYTFTMPESNVTVSATFTEMRTKASGKIGKYEKPYKVGDIVFSDGSATPYEDGLTLTDEQKSKAVAVIFYAGSASDILGAKTLGVGLKNTNDETTKTLAFARDVLGNTAAAEGYNTNFIINADLDQLTMDMVYGVESGDSETYLNIWKQFIQLWNELLPEVPLYSNIYVTVYPDWLENYEQTSYWSFDNAIVYATIAE